MTSLGLTRRQALGAAAAVAGVALTSAAGCDRRGADAGEEESGLTGIALVRAELARLLETNPLPMEAGYRRLEDGMWMVASLHHVAKANGRMIEWWHRRRKTIDEFRMWHPTAHVHCEWSEDLKANVYHHRVDGEVEKTKAQGRDTADYFDPASLAAAGVSAAVCSRGGPLDREGWAVHIVHLCRDTDYGCEVRTRLFFGDFDPAPPAVLRPVLLRIFDEKRARWLMRHQSEEYVYLARFLPALFEREAA
jgi:hypothetical protein